MRSQSDYLRDVYAQPFEEDARASQLTVVLTGFTAAA
jgi:hypothetical protein